MDSLLPMLYSIFENVVANFVVVVAGVLFAQGIRARWKEWRYGGWHVTIIEENQVLLNREISYQKAEEILGEPSELSVFLKGVVSPYGWINCDILDEGVKIGLLRKDTENRTFVINLDFNPQQKESSPTTQIDHAPFEKHVYLHIQIESVPDRTKSTWFDETEMIL